MTLHLTTWFVVALNATSGLRVEVSPDPAKIEVVASLPAKLRAQIPQGKLAQEQGENWLRLCVINPDSKEESPPMLGAYERRQDELFFRPRFQLVHGQQYRASFASAPGRRVIVDYRIPPRLSGEPALVLKVEPGTATLPANHLRFYIHFSRRMRGGRDIFDNIRIVDAQGNIVHDPWLRDELWDEAEQLLILYIHPGRIKWGLLFRDLLGPVLVPNQVYTLVIGTGVLDVDRQPLAKEFTLKFRTTAEDRKRIELSQWKVQAPKADTKQPLVVTFAKTMDRYGVERFLTVVDAKNQRTEGRIEVAKDQRTWSFHPAQAWKSAEYSIKVDGKLEDTCGNTPLSPFDVDLNTPKLPPQKLTIPFRPATAKGSAKSTSALEWERWFFRGTNRLCALSELRED